MLPVPPKLPFEMQENEAEESALPLREGVSEFRPRSRGWKTLR
jgi:hypothetical protein